MSSGKGIPFLDLVAPHIELEKQLLDAIQSVLRSAMFIGGPILDAFEREFAQFCGTRFCVGVASGTDALRFALMAAGIGRGDIVVTVPNTFVATVEAIIQAGATPKFVDVDPGTFNIDVDALRVYLDGQTKQQVKAIVPVHLYGQMCDMDPLKELAEEYGVMIFEDACQAHGAEYLSRTTHRWEKAGTIGRAGAFSFYPGKNLGACGEAGAVTTNDETLAATIRMIRDHGQNKKYHHQIEGYNGRLDALQAAILRIKLPYLHEWNSARRAAAHRYNSLLKAVDGVIVPSESDTSRGVYHLYVVRAQQRQELQLYLSERAIGTGLHYPIPVHLQQGYAHLGYRKGDFPVSEELAGEILSLPMYPQLRQDQQLEVVSALSEFYRAPVGAR
jgi:dTDP-4-amino-4,6-dideoxygalactose transaminase